MISKMYCRKAQTAVEYMLLLATVVVVVFVGFQSFFPKAQESTNALFDKQAYGIMGEVPRINYDRRE